MIVFINSSLTSIVYATGIPMVNFQGFLTNNEGQAVMEGEYQFTFSIWDGEFEESANKLWEENQQLTVSRGMYDVMLGAETPFPYTLSFAQPHYLSVQIDNGDYLKHNGSFLPLAMTWTAFRAKTFEGRIVKQVDVDYTMSQADDIVMVKGGITLTLPAPGSFHGRIFSVIKYDDRQNNSMIVGHINTKDQTITLTHQNDQVSFVSDGNTWHIFGFSVLDRIETDQKANTVDVYSKTDIDHYVSTVKLAVSDTAYITGVLSVSGKLTVDNTANLNHVNMAGKVLATDQMDINIMFADSGTIESLSAHTANFTNTSISEGLSVTGLSSLSNMSAKNIIITNASITSDLTVSEMTSLSQLNAITATINQLALNSALITNSAISGDLSVSGKTSISNLSANVGTIQQLSINSVDVTNTNIVSDLTVSGVTNLKGTVLSNALDVTGQTRLTDLTADGTSILSSVNAQSLHLTDSLMADEITVQTITANTLKVTDTATLNNLSANGSVSFSNANITNTSIASNLTVSGSTSLSQLTAITGTIAHLSSSIAQLTDTSISGALSVTGLSSLSNMSAKNINITNASIASDLTVSGITSLSQLNAITATFDNLALNSALLTNSAISGDLSVSGKTNFTNMSASVGTIQQFSANSADFTNTSIVTDLTVSGVTNLKGSVLSDTLDVTGQTRLSDLTAGGTTILSSVNAQSLNLTDSLIADEITSQTIIANNLTITDTATLNNLSANGTISFSTTNITVGNNIESFTLTRPPHINGQGTDFVIKGQNASGSNQNGGDILLIPGSKSGDNGQDGQVIIKKEATDNVMRVINYMDTDNSETEIIAFKRDINDNPLIVLKDTSADNLTRVVIAASGYSYFTGVNVGIDNVTPGYKLTVGDNAFCDGDSWLTASDRFSKKDIQDLSQYGLATIQQLRPVFFKYKSDTKQKIHLGLIAQEVVQIIPEVVTEVNDKYAIDYPQIIPVLINALQDQQGMINMLKIMLVFGFILILLIILGYCILYKNQKKNMYPKVCIK